MNIHNLHKLILAITIFLSSFNVIAHVSATHTRQYRELVQPITGSPLDERLYSIIE